MSHDFVSFPIPIPSQRTESTYGLSRSLLLGQHNLVPVYTPANGDCLPHALACAINGGRHVPGEGLHMRATIVEALRSAPDEFKSLVEQAEDRAFDAYCERMGESGVWMGEIEIKGYAAQHRAHVVVYEYNPNTNDLYTVDYGESLGAPTIPLLLHHGHYEFLVRAPEQAPTDAWIVSLGWLYVLNGLHACIS